MTADLDCGVFVVRDGVTVCAIWSVLTRQVQGYVAFDASCPDVQCATVSRSIRGARACLTRAINVYHELAAREREFVLHWQRGEASPVREGVESNTRGRRGGRSQLALGFAPRD
jgi:hypothetical protein